MTAGILESRSRVSILQRIKPESEIFLGAEVKGFKLSNFVEGDVAQKLPRHTQFAVAAASLALNDARISKSELARREVLVTTGTSLMDGESVTRSITSVATKGPRYGLMRTVQHGPVGGIPSDVARVLSLTARTLVLSTSCCAGTDAIGIAAAMVASGEADIAICGGTEAPLNLHPLVEMKMAGLASGNPENPERQGRPFDLWRTTGVIGEGAAMLVLEPEDSPRPGYALLSGYGFGLDYSVERPGCGLWATGRMAIANAGISPAEIESVSAWGPGHQLIDAVEAEALQRLFGGRLAELPVASIKGAIGNPLAAAGAMQIACAAIGLMEGFIPPTVNWEHPDPACQLNLSNAPRFLTHSSALVNAHGLSGTNASVVLTKCPTIRRS